jgi:hypothetical protein
MNLPWEKALLDVGGLDCSGTLKGVSPTMGADVTDTIELVIFGGRLVNASRTNLSRCLYRRNSQRRTHNRWRRHLHHRLHRPCLARTCQQGRDAQQLRRLRAHLRRPVGRKHPRLWRTGLLPERWQPGYRRATLPRRNRRWSEAIQNETKRRYSSPGGRIRRQMGGESARQCRYRCLGIRGDKSRVDKS